MLPDPNETLARAALRLFLMAASLLVIIAASLIPLDIIHLGEVRPFFLLAAVYYWTIVRPSMLPVIVVFAAGLLLDLFSTQPLGLQALLLITAQWLVRSQRKFLAGQSFRGQWAGFSVVVLGAGFLQWMLFSLFTFTLPPPQHIAMSAVLTALIFPLLTLPFSVVARVFAREE